MSKPNIYDENFSERMKSIANTNFKGNYSEFARAVGVAQASLARWVKGEADPSRSNLVKIAEVTNVSLEWLATGKESSNKGIVSNAFEYLGKEFAEFDGIAMLKSFKSIEVSAGFGSFNEGVTEPDGQIPYDNNLLQSLGIKPQSCGVFWASGYSMQPTICDGDQLLVDFSKKEIKNEKIYLVQNGESIWVKRVKIKWDGVELISDNKEEYPPIRITTNEAQNLQIIGQVVHIGHSLV